MSEFLDKFHGKKPEDYRAYLNTFYMTVSKKAAQAMVEVTDMESEATDGFGHKYTMNEAYELDWSKVWMGMINAEDENAFCKGFLTEANRSGEVFCEADLKKIYRKLEQFRGTKKNKQLDSRSKSPALTAAASGWTWAGGMTLRSIILTWSART